MHEIRVKVPEGVGGEIAAVALSLGIEEASVVRVYVHGPNRPAEQVSVEVSTPLGKAFVDTVMAHEQFDPEHCSITSRELRAIVSRSPVREVTRPMVETAMDVFEDLWQLSHITPSYVAGGVLGGRNYLDCTGFWAHAPATEDLNVGEHRSAWSKATQHPLN